MTPNENNLRFQGGTIRSKVVSWQATADCLDAGSYLAVCGSTNNPLQARAAGFEIRDCLMASTADGPLAIWLLRKSLSESTVARQAAATSTGGINIDGCRIQHQSAKDLAEHMAQVEAIKARGGQMEGSWKNSSDLSGASEVSPLGRWPANFLLVHTADCKRVGGPDGPVWQCPAGCPASVLNGQGIAAGVKRAGNVRTANHQVANKVYTGEWKPISNNPDYYGGESTISAVRFFYQAESLEDLWQYCTKLICPPGGLVLRYPVGFDPQPGCPTSEPEGPSR